MVAPITSGVVSKALRVGQRVPSLTSPVWKIHASRSVRIFDRLICLNEDYFIPPGSPPYEDHSCAAAAAANTPQHRAATGIGKRKPSGTYKTISNASEDEHGLIRQSVESEPEPHKSVIQFKRCNDLGYRYAVVLLRPN